MNPLCDWIQNRAQKTYSTQLLMQLASPSQLVAAPEVLKSMMNKLFRNTCYFCFTDAYQNIMQTNELNLMRLQLLRQILRGHKNQKKNHSHRSGKISKSSGLGKTLKGFSTNMFLCVLSHFLDYVNV